MKRDAASDTNGVPRRRERVDAAARTSPHTQRLPAAATCPFCSGRNSEPLATFGSLLMTSQYYCRDCRTTFEWVRRERDAEPPAG